MTGRSKSKCSEVSEKHYISSSAARSNIPFLITLSSSLPKALPHLQPSPRQEPLPEMLSTLSWFFYIEFRRYRKHMTSQLRQKSLPLLTSVIPTCTENDAYTVHCVCGLQKTEMGSACSTYGGKKCIQGFGVKTWPKETSRGLRWENNIKIDTQEIGGEHGLDRSGSG